MQGAVLLLLPLHLALGSPQEGLGNVLDSAGLNSVPMMGRKRAPLELPSFTSGFLPPKYPKYMRLRPSKREEQVHKWEEQVHKREEQEKRAPWSGAWANIMAGKPASMYNNVPGKRRPWTSSWANIMVKPKALYQNGAGKRTAVPSDWGAGYDNLLRAPQGFRFHSGGRDYLARDIMFKRAKEVVEDTPAQDDSGEDKEKKDAEPELPATTEEETQDDNLNGFDPRWLDNFESLMADASLYQPDRGPYHRTILTRVQRGRRR